MATKDVDRDAMYIWGPIEYDPQGGPTIEIALARSRARLGKFVARFRGYFVLGSTEQEVVDAVWEHRIALMTQHRRVA